MCEDGKCQERADQTRNVVISLGIAARQLAKFLGQPQMVVKAPTHFSFVNADPELHAMPGITVVMEVYPTTDDVEVGKKADNYLEGARRSVLPFIRTLEQLLGLPPMAIVPGGSTDEALQVSTQIV